MVRDFDRNLVQERLLARSKEVFRLGRLKIKIAYISGLALGFGLGASVTLILIFVV